MTKAQKGVYAAAITPLGADGVPDLAKLAAYCKRLLGEGLTGVAPAGTTGEGVSMPMAARLALPKVLQDAGLPTDRVILGTGAASTDDAVALTRASLDAGYNNVLALPPFYFKNPSDDGLYAHFARLIDGAGSDDLRLYLYHFPQMSAAPLPVAVIERLKRDFGAVVAGLKDSSGDFDGTLAFAAAADDFDVFPSSESVLLRSLDEGCAGVISATVNVAPSLAGRVLADKSALDQAALAALRELVSAFPLSAAIKQIEAWKSSDSSWCAVMPPLTVLDQAQIDALRAGLDRFGDETGVRILPAS